MRLYHMTSPQAAAEIYPNGPFISKEADGSVYFSDRVDGYAAGYGEAWVCVDVPELIAELDDEFPDGELHYRINLQDLRPEYIIGTSAGSERRKHG